MAINNKRYLAVVSLVVFVLLVLSIAVFQYNAYLLLSFLIISMIMIPFFVRFEIRNVAVREIVIFGNARCNRCGRTSSFCWYAKCTTNIFRNYYGCFVFSVRNQVLS